MTLLFIARISKDRSSILGILVAMYVCPWCPREDDIRMDLMEIGWEDVDWVWLGQDRDQWRALVTTVVMYW
jgi:hypothetical protein